MERKKRNLFQILLAAALVFGLTVFVRATDAKAAVQDLHVTQTGASSTEIELSYDSIADQDYVYVRYGTDESKLESATVHNNKAASYTTGMRLTGLSAGASYWIQVGTMAGGSAASDAGEITWSPAVEAVTAPSAPPTDLKQTAAGKTTVTVSWTASAGTDKYYVYTKKYGKKKVGATPSVTGKTTCKITGLSQGGAYQVLVYAANVSSTGFVAKSAKSLTSSVYYPTKPEKTSAPLLADGYKQQGYVRVGIPSDGAAAWADGYRFVVYDVGTGKKVAAKTTTGGVFTTKISASGSKLKKNDVYKVRVRGYVSVNGKKYYGDWSAYSYFASQKDGILSAKTTSKGIQVSWKGVKGAKKYAVYACTTQTGTYKKVKTTASKSYVLQKYNGKKLKKGKKYWFYVAPVTKEGKSTNKNMYYAWSYTYR